MTLTTPYQASFYVGDGETKTFPFVFEEVSDNFVKVIVSHIDGTTSIPTYTVDLDLKQVVFGDETPAPTADDIVCIYRETPTIQDTPFKTLEGYNAKALENILSKIVAMIQEIKSNYFSTQVLQGDPWQLDLLKSADNGATVNIDYVAKKLVKGLYFQISNGNLQVSADGSSYITMPKSADIVEFKQTAITLPDLSVVYKLQYRIGNEWFDAAESIAEATAEEAKQIAEDAKDIAQDASDAVSAHITDTNNPHSVTVAQIGALPDTTKYGATLSLTIDSTTYVVTAQLKDQDGNNLGTAQTIDLPLESVVVSGAYDSVTKEVVLTLQGGSTIRFSVADLVSGLQTEITALNMLDADLVDDTTSTHKFVTTTEKSTWNGKQDVISDLATIRSGASAGATAVQPGDLATVATSGSYTDLSNTPTIPTTLAGLTGDVSISSPSGGEHLVYDAVAGKWKNTPSAATVSWGGITGTLSDQTDLQDALNGKADVATTLSGYGITDGAKTDLSNVSNNIDFVIAEQRPGAGNNYTWYRKYKSGWVEQGQVVNAVANNSQQTITLPVPMLSRDYAWTQISNAQSGFAVPDSVSIRVSQDGTKVNIFQTNTSSANMTLCWEVKGVSAS